MHFLLDALPEFLGALGSAAVIALLLCCWRRMWRPVRHGTSTTTRPDTNSARLESDAVAPGPVHRVIGLAKVRRYTLLDTVSDDGIPIQLTTTRPAGTLITQTLKGQEQRFELTNVRLHDGTFAAEPMDRCLPRDCKRSV